MKKFSKNQELQLIGLRTVYQSLYAQCQALEKAAAEITGEKEWNNSRAGYWLMDNNDDLPQLYELLKYDEDQAKKVKKT